MKSHAFSGLRSLRPRGGLALAAGSLLVASAWAPAFAGAGPIRAAEGPVAGGGRMSPDPLQARLDLVEGLHGEKPIAPQSSPPQDQSVANVFHRAGR